MVHACFWARRRHGQSAARGSSRARSVRSPSADGAQGVHVRSDYGRAADRFLLPASSYPLRIGDMSMYSSPHVRSPPTHSPHRMWTSAAVLVVAAVVLALTWRSGRAAPSTARPRVCPASPSPGSTSPSTPRSVPSSSRASTAVGVLLVVGYLIVPGAACSPLARARWRRWPRQVRWWALGGFWCLAARPSPVAAGLRGPGEVAHENELRPLCLVVTV